MVGYKYNYSWQLALLINHGNFNEFERREKMRKFIQWGMGNWFFSPLAVLLALMIASNNDNLYC